MSYLQIGKDEGSEILIGGDRAELDGDLAGGYYIQPTIFKGTNSMRIFQEEICGPVVALTLFSDYDVAIAIAYDILSGHVAVVWSRMGHTTSPYHCDVHVST